MRWHSPNLLWLLWLLPLLGWLLYRAHQKRLAAARAFATGAMRTRIVPQFPSSRTWTKSILLLLAIATSIVAVARPKYGAYFEQVSQQGVDLFVLLDVSRSMLAEDIAPNRLERAKSDIIDLLERIPTDRIGLIVFAGKAVPRIPLTNDHTFYRQMLRDVDVDTAPIGGSLIGDAIRAGLSAMPHRSDRDQIMVLITDGEDHDSFPLDAAKLAADRGVKIITVGLGDTNDGARIPEKSQRTGVGFVKDKQGKEVWSRMDESLLKKIALETSGAYIPARTMAYDLGQIYDDHLSNLTRSEMRTEKRKRYREQFQWFTAIAFVLLASESLIRRGGTVAILVMGLSMGGPTAEANDAVAQTRLGLEAFEDGDFSRAAQLFGKAAKASPDDPRIVFNQACALAASETPAAARDLFFESALARDVMLSADSHYNLGCLASDSAKAVLGEEPLQANEEQRTESIALLNQAMGHFRDALTSDPNHQNARHNLETLRLWVKQMKALWEQKDREQDQADKNALEMLKEMDNRQLGQRTLLGEFYLKPESPYREEQINKVREQQFILADDVEPLRQKLLAENVANISDADLSKEIADGVNQTTQMLRISFESAASHIDSSEFAEALTQQRNALETLDLTYGAIAPFQEILQRSIPEQESRIAATRQAIEAEGNEEEVDPDFDDLGWRQKRVQQWATFLLTRAKEQLPMLEQLMDEAAEEQGADKDSDSDAIADSPLPGGTNGAPHSQQPLSPQDIKAQVQPLINAMAKAVNLVPQVVRLADEASSLVKSGEMQAAMPKQQSVLELLKEIADELPQDENQNQQNQNQNQDQNRDPSADDQNEQQGEQNQPGDKQNSEQNQQSDGQQESDSQQQDDQSAGNDEQDSENQDRPDLNAEKSESDTEKPEPKPDDNAPQQDEQQSNSGAKEADADEQEGKPEGNAIRNELTPARVESLLQRVRDRERQHRQIQKQLRRLMQQRQRPEKDW